ncbi:MAG: MarR family transcriptional regulator [Wenzhouxiangellaceae bacterium]
MTSHDPTHDTRLLSAWRSVIRAYQTCAHQYEKLMQQFGLTTAQFDVLAAINAVDGRCKPSDLANRLLVSKGNISGLLKRLRAQQLIHIAADASDGRAYWCELTPKARQLYQQAQQASLAFVREQLSPFSAAQHDQVEQIMRQMTRHLQTMDPASIAQPFINKALTHET